jgi:tetratricopeptide (TPR) repeat protein
VRRVWLLVLLLAAGLADAKPARRSRRTPEPPPDLWQRAIEPHGGTVKKLLGKAREALQHAEHGMDADWAIDQRQTFLVDAYHMLREAKKLSPDNTEVLALYAETADEIGKTREAIEALERVVALLGPDKSPTDVVGRLGAIKLRLGDRDAAIRWLRYTQNASLMGNSEWLVYLATALASRGEITQAVDVLQRVVPTSIPYFNDDVALVAFSLAVIYDRDEQRGAAFTVLDHMQGSMSQMYAQRLQQHLGRFRFVPGEDYHYYMGLFYESLGDYIEARAEWALYAASGDTQWRRRALDHIAAIDAQRRANPTARPTQIKPPK